MKTREAQAFNDGKLAFAEGKFRGQCARKNREQRLAWKAGWDEAQRLDVAGRATPEQLEKGRELLGRLKDWATKNLGEENAG